MINFTPIPIHEDITIKDKPTQAFVRYLQDIKKYIDSSVKVYMGTPITGDLQLEAQNQLILVDATSGEINITLPDPNLTSVNGRSYKIAITKIDESSNTVNILPFGSDLILDETEQKLRCNGDVVNLVSDGANWHLYA